MIFSALAPRTTIAPHCAATNLRLTVHLGLLVPPADAGECSLRVGDAPPRRWEIADRSS